MNKPPTMQQIKQELHKVMINITTKEEFQFHIPPYATDFAQDMIRDKVFFEKLKHYATELLLKDAKIFKDEMLALYDEVLNEYSVEKCLRFFGCTLCGAYLKEDYPTMIRMSDGFVCAFYKFYREDPTSEFVFGTHRFLYSQEVINCGLFVSVDFVRDEMDRIGVMLNDTINTIVSATNYQYVGNEFDWLATIIAADVQYRTADQVGYVIFTMGRTTLFDRDDKMNIFLAVVQELWNNHCAILVEHNKDTTVKESTTHTH